MTDLKNNMARFALPDSGTAILRLRPNSFPGVALALALAFVTVGIVQYRSGITRTMDLKMCAELRSNILTISHLVALPSASLPSTPNLPAARQALALMDADRQTIRQRYPVAVSELDASFHSVVNSLSDYGTVSDERIDALYRAVERLTGTVQEAGQEQANTFLILAVLGLTGTAFTLSYHRQVIGRAPGQQRLSLTDGADRDAAVQRFASLFAGLPIACYTFDRNGKILLWNTAAETVLDALRHPSSGNRQQR